MSWRTTVWVSKEAIDPTPVNGVMGQFPHFDAFLRMTCPLPFAMCCFLVQYY